MERDPNQPLTRPLTTDEAKARLRAAAQDVTLTSLIGKTSWLLIAAAVAGGFAAARLRLPSLLGSVLIQRAAPMLLSLFLGKKGCCSKAPEDSSLKSK